MSCTGATIDDTTTAMGAFAFVTPQSGSVLLDSAAPERGAVEAP